MNVIDKFISLLIDMEEEALQVPIIHHPPDTTFIFIKYNNVYGTFFFCLYIKKIIF